MTRHGRIKLAVTLALALGMGASVQAQGPEPVSGTCVVREIGRVSLRPDSGTALYVEPVLLAPGPGGRLLLAGSNNLLQKRASSGEWVRQGGEDIFGVVTDAAGTVRMVPSPVPGSGVMSPRAVARGDDAWSVVFVETGRDAFGPDSWAVRGLWHAELRGTEWTGLEPVPGPEGQVEAYSPSALLLRDDTLDLAVVIQTPNGLNPLVVLERAGGGWTHQVVPAPFASQWVHTLFAAEPALARRPDGSLMLAALHPDLTLPNDGNSLFLWRRGESWTSLGKMVASQRETINHPAVAVGGWGDLLSWMALPHATGGPFELHAVAGPAQVHGPPILTVDPHITYYKPVDPVRLGTEYLFVTDHVLEGDEREIRFGRLTRDGVEPISAVPSRFIANFAAAATDDSTVVVTGGEGETSYAVLTLYHSTYFVPRYDVIYSRMLWFRVTCGPKRW